MRLKNVLLAVLKWVKNFKFIKSNGDIQISLANSKSKLVPRQKKKRPTENTYMLPTLESLRNFLLSKLVVSMMEAL